jgi:hypothetical protein
MPPFGMWRRVGLVRTDVSEERVACRVYTEDGGDMFLRSMPEDGILLILTLFPLLHTLTFNARRRLPAGFFPTLFCYGNASSIRWHVGEP